MQKLGVREICEVVLKAKATMKVGNKMFYRNEPVLYFDSLKTSSLEGAATSVYAQGGRGNSRLIGWEGERTVTFTMEDALISPESFMILSGAGLIEPIGKKGDENSKPIYHHVVESTEDFEIEGNLVNIYLDNEVYLPTNAQKDNFAYVMTVDHEHGDMSEPFIPMHGEDACVLMQDGPFAGKYRITVEGSHPNYAYNGDEDTETYEVAGDIASIFSNRTCHVLVDYYTPKYEGEIRQIEITPDKFGGNFYLEASTLFRDTNGVDLPAEFIIPNCKIQSNFTFSMASTGDPSTFTFTMDAFPDYTRFDHSHKVLAAIQIVASGSSRELSRGSTAHEVAHDAFF